MAGGAIIGCVTMNRRLSEVLVPDQRCEQNIWQKEMVKQKFSLIPVRGIEPRSPATYFEAQ